MTGAVPLLAAGLVVATAIGVVRPLGLRPADRRAAALAVVPRDPAVVPAWFQRRATDADLAPAERWWWGAVTAIGLVGLGGLRVGGPAAALVGAGLGAGGVLVALSSLRHRRGTRLARSVPDALDAVARSCRAGASVPQALRDLAHVDVGPAGALLADVVVRVDRGMSLDRSLAELVDAHPSSPVRLAAAALLVGSESGAAPARAVDGVAATLRDRAALEREAQALATQAKASVAVLVLAPLGFGAMAVAGDPRVADFLFRQPIGIACLAVGIGLDAVGAWWMHRLVRRPR